MAEGRCYVVMHDYGREGWQIVSKHDNVWSAVIAREDYIRSCGGGTTEIYESREITEWYRLADYQRMEVPK
jgi:hypothetical protein